MLNKNKLGELTTQQIVMLVILIVSFAVILIFLFFLDLGKQTDSQICHDSVVLRGNSVLPSDSVPLKCNTQYLCLTNDKSCESMTNPKIEKVDSKEQVYNTLAEQMVNCWWMYGEGKVDYVGKDFKSNLYCSICSQIGFDDSVNQIFPDGKIPKKDFYDYLSQTKISGKEYTYIEYLFGTKSVPGSYKDKNGNEVTLSSGDYGNIDLRNRQYVLTGMYSKINFLGWGAAIGTVVGTVIVAVAVTGASGGTAGPAALAVSGAVIHGLLVTIPTAVGIGVVAGKYFGSVVQGKSGNNYISPTIVEADDTVFKQLNCSDINTLA